MQAVSFSTCSRPRIVQYSHHWAALAQARILPETAGADKAPALFPGSHPARAPSAEEMMMETVHFHRSDDRFCGSSQKRRRFSFDENEINCQACKAKDCLQLTAQGVEYVAKLTEDY